MKRPNYEEDEKEFAGAFTVRGYRGVAWHAMGWETQPTEETEWTGFEERTSKVVCIMVGDDRRFTFDREDLTPLRRSEYCGACGQVGCHRDAYEED